MSVIAKRLCEALVGAAVQKFAPDAELWAPSIRELETECDTYRSEELVLQCSWAEIKRRGPSTRVNRALVDTYRSITARGAWSDRVHFVLVGNCAAGRFDLFLIGLADLIDVVAEQQRGTINADRLHSLRSQPSSHRPSGPCAVPIEAALSELEEASWSFGSGLPVNTHGRRGEGSVPKRHFFSHPFFNRPTPLRIRSRPA